MSNSSDCCKPIACIGSGSSLAANTTLLKTNLCQPLQQPCDEQARTIFFSGANPNLSGVITINNTSTDCIMTVEVTDGNGSATYTIEAQSSIAVGVLTLNAITLSCTGPAGPDPDMSCTGSFEANLNYCAKC
ncbi:hypothetical protein LWS67_21270 [Bacillus atrophaeus]|uniref:S-Ena type endospore appendage n=1 Tax=Bacillus atrophaeus TaxID=1452 RepID=UPI001EFA4DF7|nr:S-Ena type endospore appendage [Bacillus atrophaeus]MCG8399029.1 hypothetical protein [Bacillus atrophaeus]